MTRVLVSFLLGSLVTAGAVIAADSKTWVLFAAGAASLFVLQLALLASVRRARGFARFLSRLCDFTTKRRSTRQASRTAQDRQVSRSMRREFKTSMKSDEKANHREAAAVRRQWNAAARFERPSIAPRKAVSASDPNFAFFADSDLVA